MTGAGVQVGTAGKTGAQVGRDGSRHLSGQPGGRQGLEPKSHRRAGITCGFNVVPQDGPMTMGIGSVSPGALTWTPLNPKPDTVRSDTAYGQRSLWAGSS